MSMKEIPFSWNGKDYVIRVEHKDGKFIARPYLNNQPAGSPVTKDATKAIEGMENPQDAYSDIVDVVKDNIKKGFNMRSRSRKASSAGEHSRAAPSPSRGGEQTARYAQEEREMSENDALKEKIEELKAETKRDPNHTSAWENLGDAYREAKNWEKAIDAYTRAIDLARQEEEQTPEFIKQNPDFCPDTASLYEKRGMAYERNLDFVNATADRKQAAKLRNRATSVSFKEITRILEENMADCKQENSVKNRQLTKKIDWVTRLTIWGFIISVWGLIASVIGDVFGFECKISLFKLVVVVGGLVIGVVLEVVFKMWVWFNSRYNEQEPQTASKGET